ncbi:unnamed protein product [Leptidea sinapis]|uniref:C2H2-type domain-containing protein n=1 Tax=Leptidea sinapis TaxID=189913 RepID=A0A5E4R0X8_9NEOP|nr:unnamed protein product [Leptidea sinapis]
MLIIDAEVKPYCCDECDKRFASFQELKTHTSTHTSDIEVHGRELYSSQFDENSSVESDDSFVIESNHDTDSDYEPLARYKRTKNLLHRCNVCGQSFSRPCELTRHYRKHSGEKPYHCKVCNKFFRHQSNLNVHVKGHSVSATFTCNVCNTTLKSSYALRKHRKTHNREESKHSAQLKDNKSFRDKKLNTCDICNKAFLRPCELTRHYRTHTGEKPFPCEVCHEPFADPSNLLRHMKRHTGNKPFMCTVCNKTFLFSSQLELHYSQHTGERPHQCDVCGNNYGTTKALQRHKKRHTERTMQSCLEFDGIFSSSEHERNVYEGTMSEYMCSQNINSSGKN